VIEGHFFTAHPAGAPLLSGGQTGPEGSVLALGCILCIAAGMAAWWGRRGPGVRAGLAPAPRDISAR
jgi:hypothetical protein